MVSISPDDLALELLNQCLRGNSHSRELLETLLRMALSPDQSQARRASHALFSIVVERLADLFEPCLCDSYAALFADVIGFALPDLEPEPLLERYKRIRQPRTFSGDFVQNVFVLSRVTLGADVAVTSLCLDAMKQRFPSANIFLVSPAKNYELFAADPRITHAPVPYGRDGTLSSRLSIYPALRELLSSPHTLVIDPDSRLTQLGLLPVCPEESYYFLESRSYGGYSDESLPEITRRWIQDTFGVMGNAYIAPIGEAPAAQITVSLGVGDNPAKRIGDPFERELMRRLSASGKTILIDRGGSEEEAARVDRAVEGLPDITTWTGSFAPFAGSIARSGLYAGYDSAGQHVAAARGVPLLTIFAGYPSPRMFHRWSPFGPGPKRVVRLGSPDPEFAIRAADEALEALQQG